MPQQFEIEIVHGIDKSLVVTESESLQQVKLDAMNLFDIPATEANQYVLRIKVQGQEQQLNESETVEQAKLHPEQKVILAAGAPFGGC